MEEATVPDQVEFYTLQPDCKGRKHIPLYVAIKFDGKSCLMQLDTEAFILQNSVNACSYD